MGRRQFETILRRYRDQFSRNRGGIGRSGCPKREPAFPVPGGSLPGAVTDCIHQQINGFRSQQDLTRVGNLLNLLTN
jgi:hypothetical protein